MASRMFWIYQRRSNPVPWAICIEKDWDRRKPRDALLTVMIYSERVDNPMHCVTIYDMKHDEIGEYTDAIADAIREFDTVTEDDIQQIKITILDILTDNSLYNRR